MKTAWWGCHFASRDGHKYPPRGSPLECISKGTLFRFDISLSSSLDHQRDTERTWWDLKIAYFSCRSSGAHCSGRYPGKSCQTCAEHNLICHRWWDKPWCKPQSPLSQLDPTLAWRKTFLLPCPSVSSLQRDHVLGAPAFIIAGLCPIHSRMKSQLPADFPVNRNKCLPPAHKQIW